MIDEYRECVRICAEIEYSDITSVKRSNKAVDKMYQIVEKANNEGVGAIADLATLLDEPDCAKWLAHQLVEKATITKEIENKCFAIVEVLAKGDGPDAFGEQAWLEEHRDHGNR